MKWLLSLLLLVNLAIFVWHYQGDRRQTEIRLNDETSQLVLLKEYLARQEKNRFTGERASQTMCYTLGPFEKKSSSKKVLAKLKKAKVEAWQRMSKDVIKDGYWVLIPPSKSSQKASELLKSLKQKKVADFFLVATGEQTNAISLGVFSKPKLARARLNEINKLGFKARVEKITLPKRVYWVDWHKQADQQPLAKLLESLREQFKGLGQAERKCKPQQDSSPT